MTFGDGITIGVLISACVSAPVFFALGVFAAMDRRKTHEPADITPALRRSRRASTLLNNLWRPR